MSYWSYYPPYVSVAKKRAKADKKLKSLQKKNPNIRPVVIEGRTIARTWWGKAWNTNLESYADYTNRIGRGRSYVRNGSVLDLQIQSGLIKALVQGALSRPYKVQIKIKSLKKDIWRKIKTECQGSFDSLQELLQGSFPKSLSDTFTNQKSGLFPSPKEISFDCSCPDWANMCKHVAAALYGIGARLDSEPDLFFTLRNVKMEDLITEAVKDQTTSLISKAERTSSKVIDDSNLSEIFGIDIDETPTQPKPTPRKLTKKRSQKSAKNIKKAPFRKTKKFQQKKKTTARKLYHKK
ncbi:MAG: hypothetical protein KAR05_08615 [Candidatus Omnitrophica bacterium]|nr:hypothetical protein [Candidatus Omnitrophota bacterium]